MSNLILFLTWFFIISGLAMWFFPDTDITTAVIEGVVFGCVLVLLTTAYKDDGNDNGSLYN